jgi:hypothetical protein
MRARPSDGRAVGEQEEPNLDAADGSCRQRGHSFDAHIAAAHDRSDFSKGGTVRCPRRGIAVVFTA